jgi:hypothetical protein
MPPAACATSAPNGVTGRGPAGVCRWPGTGPRRRARAPGAAAGRAHAQRREERARDVLGERPPRVALDEHAEEHVPGVAVPQLGAGVEVERPAAHAGDRGRRAGRAPARGVRIREVGEVGEAGRVREQVPHRHPPPPHQRPHRGVREVPRDRVVQPHAAVLHQPQHGGRGHLLGERRDREHVVRAHGHAARGVGAAVAAREQRVASAEHHRGEAGHVAALHGRARDRVERRDDVRPRRGGRLPRKPARRAQQR